MLPVRAIEILLFSKSQAILPKAISTTNMEALAEPIPLPVAQCDCGRITTAFQDAESDQPRCTQCGGITPLVDEQTDGMTGITIVESTSVPGDRAIYAAFKDVSSFRKSKKGRLALKKVDIVIANRVDRPDVQELIEQHGLQYLTGRVRHLVKNGVFSSSSAARRMFPDLRSDISAHDGEQIRPSETAAESVVLEATDWADWTLAPEVAEEAPPAEDDRSPEEAAPAEEVDIVEDEAPVEETALPVENAVAEDAAVSEEAASSGEEVESPDGA